MPETRLTCHTNQHASAPKVRVFHRTDGWVTPDFTDLADCTTNFHREQDGRPACTNTAVWKVVEDHGMHVTIRFYCDADLPEAHRHLAAAGGTDSAADLIDPAVQR